jgi:hypothetical protein
MSRTVVVVLMVIVVLAGLGIAAVYVATGAFVGAAKENASTLDAQKIRIDAGYHRLPAVTTMPEHTAAWITDNRDNPPHWEYTLGVVGDRKTAAESLSGVWSGAGCDVAVQPDIATADQRVEAYCKSLGLYLATSIPQQGEARVYASEARIDLGVATP